jgi:hypothetical protein
MTVVREDRFLFPYGRIRESASGLSIFGISVKLILLKIGSRINLG